MDRPPEFRAREIAQAASQRSAAQTPCPPVGRRKPEHRTPREQRVEGVIQLPETAPHINGPQPALDPAFLQVAQDEFRKNGRPYSDEDVVGIQVAGRYP